MVLIFLLFHPHADRARIYNIVDFGALGNGITMDTKAIQSAIDKANEDGGGEVVVPDGRYLTGTLILKSNVNLHLEKGGVILGSTSPFDYPSIVSILDKDKVRYPNIGALIEANGGSNISITGAGTIDGQGQALALELDSLFYAGKLDSAHYDVRRRRPDARPTDLGILNCRNVTVSDITLRAAAFWVEKYDKCRNLRINHIKVESVAYWNNDGMDIVDCTNARVTDCFINAADDGICLKSENKGFMDDSVYISDCTVRSSASAVKFGTASVGGFKNVIIKNIKAYDTFRSAIAIECVDGGNLENVLVDGITAVNTGNPVFIRLGHRDVNGPYSTLRNVTIENIKVEVPFGRPDINYKMRGPSLPFAHNPFPSSIVGIPGHDVENVTLKNIEVSMPGRADRGYAIIPIYRLNEVPEEVAHYPEFSMFGELPAWGFYVRHVDGLTMENMTVKTRAHDFRPCFVFDDVHHLNLHEITMSKANDRSPIVFKNVTDQTVKSLHITGLGGRVPWRVNGR